MAEEQKSEVVEEPKPVGVAAVSSQSATGIGIAALVVGIVAFLSGFLPILGLLVAATAIVLSVIALKKSKANKPFGIAGLVLGCVGAVTNLFVSAFWVLAFVATFATGSAALTASKAVTSALSAQQAVAQKEIDAKKDFAKGETARFGTYDVKVNSVDTNYQSSNSYSQPSDGQKYVLVNITASNPGTESVSVYDYEIKLSADGVANSQSFTTIPDPFTGGSLAKGASSTGNIIYSVKTDASVLKLQYETNIYTPKTFKPLKLTYTLAL